jgi:hypothetical protein
MNLTKKLICILVAGTALGAAAPSFADSWHGRGHDYDRYSRYERFDRHDRFDHRFDYRGPRYYRRDLDRRVVVVERPYVVERAVPYYEPAPQQNLSLGGLIGGAIGTIIDQQQ